MKKMVILAGMLACIGISAKAQDGKKEEPKGKAIIQVFGNFNASFENDEHSLGFVLERSYLGYEYNLGKGLSIKGVMDVGKSSAVDDCHRQRVRLFHPLRYQRLVTHISSGDRSYDLA